MADTTTRAKLESQGYHVLCTMTLEDPKDLPSQEIMDKHEAKCAFRLNDGSWALCSPHPEAPANRTPRKRKRST